MGKEYQVVCPAGQQDALRRAAHHLDEQMNNIRRSGKVIGLERIAVMAALNISNELLQSEHTQSPNTDAAQAASIGKLNDKLDEALHRFKQLEIN
jgi:cell division protein ZapA